jgi:DNA-binding XRE family transcriptional regulator
VKPLTLSGAFLFVVLMGLQISQLKTLFLQTFSMSSSKKIIGKIIKYHRKKIGFTMEELANRLEVDRQYIWKMENGKKNVSPDYLDKVIEKLGCKHDDFFNTSFID